jgi:hypothetical protein
MPNQMFETAQSHRPTRDALVFGFNHVLSFQIFQSTIDINRHTFCVGKNLLSTSPMTLKTLSVPARRSRVSPEGGEELLGFSGSAGKNPFGWIKMGTGRIYRRPLISAISYH